MVAGGVGYGAEYSNPGDTLYPVKVNINENLRGATKFSAQSETEWKSKLADRRLEEAEALATKGELTAEVATDLEAHFDSHLESYEKTMAELRENKKYQAMADISASFETSLQERQAKLETASLNLSAELKAQIDSMMGKIDNQISSAQTVQTEANTGLQAEGATNITDSETADPGTTGGAKVDVYLNGQTNSNTNPQTETNSEIELDLGL